MAADYEFNTAEQWASGEHTDSHAVDPSGKLTPGVSPEILAENVSENDLAVYLRCREGTGTAIENVGSAGDGTLTPGTWKTRADGRHYIQGGTVTVPYHASMKVSELDDNDDETSSYDWVAQIRVRFSSIAAAIFEQRPNRFQLGMDASGKPYIKNYYHISRVYNNQITLDEQPQGEWFYLSNSNLVNGSVSITDEDGGAVGFSYEVDNAYGKIKFTSGGEVSGTFLVDYMHHEDSGWSELKDDTALEVDTWYTIGAVCNGGSLTLYVDRVAVATLSSNYCDNDSGEDLVAGFVGDWDAVMYSGNASSSNLVSFPSSGSWEKIIALEGDRAVRYLEMEVALNDEHSISVGITFDDDEDNLPYVRGWSYSRLVDGYNMIYPPEAGLYHGTKMLVKVSLSQGAYDREAVLVDYLKIHLREPATPIEEQTKSPYEDMSMERVTAEDLSGLIRQVQANRTVIQDLYRTVRRSREKETANFGGGGWDAGSGVPGGGSEPDDDRIFEIWPVTLQNVIDAYGDTLSDHSGRLVALENDMLRAFDWIATNGNFASDLGVRVAELENAGYATQTFAEQLVTDHNAAADAHDNGAGTSLYDHKILSSNVHGASEGDPLMSLADTNTAIGNHAALTSEVHGAPAGKPIAYASEGTADVLTTAAGFITAGLENGGLIDDAIDALIATHAALTTDVHGVTAGEGYLLGNTEIVTGTANLIAAHEGSAVAHGSVESNFASHKDATSGVHGVGGNHVAISTQTFDTVENLISTHDGSGSAHGNVESNFASHKDDPTAVHGVADMTALATEGFVTGSISTHASDTTYVHGIDDTSVLCTEPC